MASSRIEGWMGARKNAIVFRTMPTGLRVVVVSKIRLSQDLNINLWNRRIWTKSCCYLSFLQTAHRDLIGFVLESTYLRLSIENRFIFNSKRASRLDRWSLPFSAKGKFNYGTKQTLLFYCNESYIRNKLSDSQAAAPVQPTEREKYELTSLWCFPFVIFHFGHEGGQGIASCLTLG